VFARHGLSERSGLVACRRRYEGVDVWAVAGADVQSMDASGNVSGEGVSRNERTPGDWLCR
jgi:1,2-phenylacetyl-CoA epoxidase PaaB subunit